MPFIEVNNIKLSYTGEGSGFPLVLLHGLSDDYNLWALLLPEFAKKYRTIAIDLRGHGQSGKPDIPYSIELFASDLYGFLKKLGISKANFAGLSMGASIIQQFTLEHPDMVNAISMLSAFDCIDDYSRANFEKLRDSLRRGGLEAFFDQALELVVTPAFRREHGDSLKLLMKQAVRVNSAVALSRAIDACEGFNLRNRIKAIKAPTLIISGREDIFTPTHFAEEIHRSIKGSELVVIEGVGHNLMVPENIEPLTRLILDFLEKHPPESNLKS
jgi:3-oxoadipate enol-lactonase